MPKQVGDEVRTSASHPIQVNWLPAAVADRVGLTFAPGKKGRSREGFYWDRDLVRDLDVLAREHRVATLVSLMEPAELAEMGLKGLLAEAQRHDITVLPFPIPDVHAPREPRDVDPLLDDIEESLARGERVVIHCLGGIGRTGTIATCLLVRRGVPLAEAIRIVRETRCKAFPESASQQKFVSAFERHVADRRQPSRDAAVTQPAANATSWILGGDIDRATAGAGGKQSREQVRTLLADIEKQIKASPSTCFGVTSDGAVTLSVKGRTYHAGCFEAPTIAALKERIRSKPTRTTPGRIRLSILRGTGPKSDIGTLQAIVPDGALFQAASQFNCLEAPSNRLVPISQYTSDPTQGPRASVSAFPGTFLRHYFAPRPDGARFVQTDQDCINLLADAIDPTIASVKSGYLQSDHIKDADAVASALVERFEQIHVGLHDDVEVVLGHDWGGGVPNAPRQRIAQVFTSTIALGGYSRDDGSSALTTIRQQLLRAAYLGTLLGAVALGKHTVMLTMIGGGVFANPHEAIWDAIHWAISETEPLANGIIDVVVNVRDGSVRDADMTRSAQSGGSCIDVSTENQKQR